MITRLLESNDVIKHRVESINLRKKEGNSLIFDTAINIQRGTPLEFFDGFEDLSEALKEFRRLSDITGTFRIDVVNFAGGAIGVTHTVDLFYKQTMITFPGFTSMVGFVGYSFKIPTAIHVFIGFSVATFGIGLGIKLKEWVF